MSANDLTTLSRVKTWLGIDTVDSDAVLSQEITRISSMIAGYLNNVTFLQRTRTEFYNGKGNTTFYLRNFPVLSVTNLVIDGITIPPNPTPPTGSGFMLQVWDGVVPAGLQGISLVNYYFSRGMQNVQVTYVSGYVAQNEAQTVISGSVTPNQPDGMWVADSGVKYANTGVALTAVASSPAVGQYVPPNPLAGGSGTTNYTFNSGDNNANILISYSFVPWAIEMVAKDLVAERYRYKDRIGTKSKSLGGQETISYEMNVIPKWAQVSLQPFMNQTPVG